MSWWNSLRYRVLSLVRRQALGANLPDIFAMIIERGMLIVLAGLIIGNVAALGLTRFRLDPSKALQYG